MKRLVEFPLEEGGTILVEVDEPERDGMEPAAPDDVVVKAQHTFEHALDKIRPAAEVIITKLRTLSSPPTEVQVVFGLKLSAEAGAFVASAGMEANYEITLTWQRDEK